MIGEVDKKIKRLTEKGITLIEGLVATAITYFPIKIKSVQL
mgnify:CR=1 FL=1